MTLVPLVRGAPHRGRTRRAVGPFNVRVGYQGVGRGGIRSLCTPLDHAPSDSLIDEAVTLSFSSMIRLEHDHRDLSRRSAAEVLLPPRIRLESTGDMKSPLLPL